MERYEAEVKELITLWKEEEVLCNLKHEKYYKKDEKQKLWNWIANKLISCGFSKIKDSNVNEKITPLSSYYDIEKRKEKSSEASGSGTSNVYVSLGGL